MHEGSRTTVVSRRPQNANGPRRSPVNSGEYSTIKSPTDGADIISQKLSMLDSLLDDLNSARRSYDHPDHASCNSASTLPSNRRSAHSPTSNGYASLHRHNRSPSPGMYNTSTTTTLIYTSSSLLFLFLPICTCVFPLFAVAQLAKLYEYLNRGGVSLASAITLCEYSHQRVKCVRVVTGSIKGSTRASFFFACLLSCYGRPISRLDEEENPLCPATAPFRPCLSLDSVCDHRH